MRASEALEVSKAVYKAYGYSYPHEQLYYLEKITELNRRGEILSVVAVADQGAIAGHCSLQPWEENPHIAELTQGVVKPQYRSQGCFARLTEYLIAEARARDFTAVFGEAVTVHPYSQKAALQFGLRDCALLLGYIPASAQFKGSSPTADPERTSALIQFKYLKPPTAAQLFPPQAHHPMIAAIYANLGITTELRSATADSRPSAADSTVTVTLSRSLNLARIRVDRWGSDGVETLPRHVKALCQHQRQVIQLWLGLADPLTAVMADRCEALVFFFAGVRDSPRAFKLYYFTFIALGFLLCAYIVRDFPLQRFPEVLVFAFLIVVADSAQITLPRGGASIYASSPFDLAAIVLLGPAAAVLVEAIASFFTEVIVQRRAAMKYAFNVPLLIATVGCAGLAYWAFPEGWQGASILRASSSR